MTFFKARSAPASLTATTSLITLTAASNRPVWIREVTVSSDGVDSTEAPIEFQICRCSNAGTGTGLTLINPDQRDSTGIVTTALEVITVEPTVTAILASFYMPVYQSSIIYVPVVDHVIAAGGFLALRCVGAPAPATNFVATISGQE